MSTPLVDEIFSDVMLIVDLTAFQRNDEVDHILNGFCKKSKGSYCEITCSFKDAEDVFWKLSSLKRSDDPKFQTQDHQDYSTVTEVGTVEVAETVMDYINEKYSQELGTIVGHAVSMKVNKVRNKMFVSFQPQDHRKEISHCHFARERFITFYQKIATNLQARTFRLDPALMRGPKLIEQEFPKLLISDDSRTDLTTGCISVTGSYADMLGLQEFLRNGATSSYKLAVQQRPQSRTTSNGASASSRAQSPQKEKEEMCPICLDTIMEMEKKILPRCQHSFCRDCLKRAFDSKPACPICGMIYGSLKGTQPDKGTMEVTTVSTPLPGYAGYGSIVIKYYIPSGIQGEEHPNPGQSYEGASRTAYLPDSPEGRKVLKHLKKAFEQRLIFTVGQSSTTGRSNVVTWNDIHHKTSRDGGPTNYGYPDPEYLDRVQEELKAKGIY